MKSRIKRISQEADDLIKKIAFENQETYVKASEIVARLARQNTRKKIMREIKF